MGQFILFTHGTMKLIYPLVAALGTATVWADGHEVSDPSLPMENPDNDDFCVVDWLEMHVPGFKQTKKWFQFKNEDMGIFMKYTYDKKFQLETPWFSESWAINSDDEWIDFEWAGNMFDSYMSELYFKQGMETLKKEKNGKMKKIGYQWIREMATKTWDEQTKKDEGMIWYKQKMTAQFDKKERYTG